MSTTPPGFYPNPNDQTELRYWNGAEWTDEKRPAPPQMLATTIQGEEGPSIIPVGYVMAIVIPFIGFLIGLGAVFSSSKKVQEGGRGIMALSIVAFFVWYVIFTGSDWLY